MGASFLLEGHKWLTGKQRRLPTSCYRSGILIGAIPFNKIDGNGAITKRAQKRPDYTVKRLFTLSTKRKLPCLPILPPLPLSPSLSRI